MPIENEMKYVLQETFNAIALKGWKHISVKQGYINSRPRIREYGDSYVFTYKHWREGANVPIEIETEISKEDFDLMWPDCQEIVRKDRYVKKIGEDEWFVDFLKDEDGEIYFVMAEVEMPEGKEKPTSVPDEIKNHILLEVDKGDRSFSNRKLSNKKYARKMLKEIKNKL